MKAELFTRGEDEKAYVRVYTALWNFKSTFHGICFALPRLPHWHENTHKILHFPWQEGSLKLSFKLCCYVCVLLLHKVLTDATFYEYNQI